MIFKFQNIKKEHHLKEPQKDMILKTLLKIFFNINLI